MRLFDFFHGNPHQETAEALHAILVKQARLPVFFADLDVADTPEGRFDMVILHAFLLFNRLKEGGEETADLAQAVYDVMFAFLKIGLREMGIGDTGMTRRVKDMTEAFRGRCQAYEDGLAETSDETLMDALDRNLYRKTSVRRDCLEIVAQYMRAQKAHLARQSLSDIKRGRASFTQPATSQKAARHG